MKFVTNTNLGNKTIFVLFSIKVAAGIVLGLVSVYYFNGITDYNGYNENGILEYYNLIHKPKLFFTDIFISNYGNSFGDFFGVKNSYFNDLRGNIVGKALAFFNFLSRGNYFINSLFFNFFGFLGHIALYKLFNDAYPNKKWVIIIGCFFIPSTLYYSSGIQKDLIVFVGLSFFCYAMYFGLKNGFTYKKITTIILSFLLLLAIRNFVAILLLPFAFTWYFSNKIKLNPLKTYGVILSLFISVTIFLHLTSPKTDPLKIVINRQQAFLDLGRANTQYANDTLHGNITSFVMAAPKALRHSFLSPLPTEFQNIFLQLLSLEVIAFAIIIGLFFAYRDKKTKPFFNSFTLFCVVFVFLIFLFMGYITPNAGTLVRYRSIYLPFIITPILCAIDWDKVFKKINTF
jgi:hypothetical protein